MHTSTKKWLFIKVSSFILIPFILWFIINFVSIIDNNYYEVVNFFKSQPSKVLFSVFLETVKSLREKGNCSNDFRVYDGKRRYRIKIRQSYKTKYDKCLRCWQFKKEVESNKGLCDRCRLVLRKNDN